MNKMRQQVLALSDAVELPPPALDAVQLIDDEERTEQMVSMFLIGKASPTTHLRSW